MIINISLIVLATIVIVLGCTYAIGERNASVHIMIALSSISIFFWIFGYGVMGFCTSDPYRFIWRSVGLSGVYLGLIVELVFVFFIAKINKIIRRSLTIFLGLFALINLILLSNPDIVTFVQVGDRTTFYSASGLARQLQTVLLACLFVTMFITAIYWYIKVIFKRDKHIIAAMIVAHFVLLFSCAPDSILLSFGLPSFPGSCYGAFVMFIVTLYVAKVQNAFDLQVSNVSNYIMKYVDFSVLVLDYSNKIYFENEFARSFFNINEKSRITLQDIFVLDDETESEIFSNPDSGSKSVQLNKKDDDTPCSLTINAIFDKHGELICSICFVYDLSYEKKLYNEVNLMKKQLQEDLKVKSRELELLMVQSIETVANALEAKDQYTKGHSERVAEYSLKIAKALGWSEDELLQLRSVALLHDIGKIGVKDYILNNPNHLTDEEYSVLKQHTVMGAEILKDITIIPGLDDGARYHHERYDGLGYPTGLSGENIPLTARIIAIADSYDAMNSKRIYRDPLPKEVIIKELLAGRGSQFDPELLDIFMREVLSMNLANTSAKS